MNLSYKEIFKGNTIMVIVPHEDDEINIAGATIFGAKKAGMRVICAFLTNGDWDYPASIRIKEACAALKTLGVPETDIIFLGYPDSGVKAERSVYMHGQKAPVNVFGQMETYGAAGKQDYAMYSYGYHSPYTWDCFLTDLKNVILEYRPNTILAIDFDFHPDHRMSSIAFEMVMGEILNRLKGSYQPLVLKAFAYATGFESVADFYHDNLYSTKVEHKALRYPEFGLDNPVYEWGKRVRLPVPKECRYPQLMGNILFSALKCHMSQKAMRRANQIINGDQVFWLRRTDNLAFLGDISVSSGNEKYLHDFQMMNTQDISVRKPAFENYLWMPYIECIDASRGTL